MLLDVVPSIKTYTYIDLPPMLYFGTQYLRAFLGSQVADYLETRELTRAPAHDNGKRRVFCIPPGKSRTSRRMGSFLEYGVVSGNGARSGKELLREAQAPCSIAYFGPS